MDGTRADAAMKSTAHRTIGEDGQAYFTAFASLVVSTPFC